MKKIFFFLFMSGTFLLTNAADQTSVNFEDHKKVQQVMEWENSKSGIWTGKWEGTLYFYKVSGDKLYRSKDKNTWAEVENKRWADYDGKWVQVDTGNLVWSNDSGRTWAPVPERRWRAANGKWYMFDQRWNLMIEK